MRKGDLNKMRNAEEKLRKLRRKVEEEIRKR
jgi:hypothetical protein